MQARQSILCTLASVAAAGVLVVGCSSSGSKGGSATAAKTGSGTKAVADAALLGTPHAASGSPVLFGVLNLESGPVAFPEVLQAEKAAVAYVNAYKGGIGGHPIKLVSCVTDGQPSTSQRCANQIADDKPVAILGAADTGAPGAIAVWGRNGLPYLGGIPFTPVEENYANSVLFANIGVADAAGAVYAVNTLHAKSAAIIYTSDTQGNSIANTQLVPTFKSLGLTKITKVGIPPTSSDVSSAVATVVGAHPDVVYVSAPAACPAVLSSLKQLGNTAKVIGIDPCSSPRSVAGSNGGAEGMYFGSPTLDPGDSGAEAQLYRAVLKKYAPSNIILDSGATIGFQTVMDVQAALKSFTPADLTRAKIMAAFRTGKATHNFMGHDYLCDGKQLVRESAACNAYAQIRQVKGTAIAGGSSPFVSTTHNYQG